MIVHDAYWTAAARHADIVLPATITLERDDIGAAGSDEHLVAMHRVVEPFGEARDDYGILTGLARELGCEAAFTEGRTPGEWLRALYDRTRAAAAGIGCDLPTFDEFWARGEVAPATDGPTDPSRGASEPIRPGRRCRHPVAESSCSPRRSPSFGDPEAARSPGLARAGRVARRRARGPLPART